MSSLANDWQIDVFFNTISVVYKESNIVTEWSLTIFVVLAIIIVDEGYLTDIIHIDNGV